MLPTLKWLGNSMYVFERRGLRVIKQNGKVIKKIVNFCVVVLRYLHKFSDILFWKRRSLIPLLRSVGWA